MLQFLARASREMTTVANPAEALWSLVTALRDHLPIDRAGIFAFDPFARTLQRVAGVGQDGQPEFQGPAIAVDRGAGPLREVIRRELPYYFSDDATRDYPRDDWAPGVRAHAIIPIIAGDHCLGALCVDNCLTGRTIPETVVEPLFLYAGLAALPLFALYQQKERERADRLRWETLRQVFAAVTSGKVCLCDQHEVDMEWPDAGDAVCIDSVADIPALREVVRHAGVEAGMADDRARDFELCVSEAATNALLHGEGGIATVASVEGIVRARVEDSGRGISLDDLPGATLQPGWSKRQSMGLGFTLIQQTSDRVFLSTGPQGTTVIIEMAVEPQINLPEATNPLLWGEAFSL